MSKAFEEVYFYMGLLSYEPTRENIRAAAGALKAAGVTRAAINHLPDIMHPELLSQPENMYLWFANFGPSLDQFVSSRLNEGLYPETYLERNRRTLLRFAEIYREAGIRPMLYLCEPRFVPERFFRRHPMLRGSRVDNPVASDAPLYALCVDYPEVIDHYREMLAKVLALVPDLGGLALFTSDSGAGFDYNPASYAGANGAGFNRGIPLVRRVSRFLNHLLEEGRLINPDFEVILTSGFEKSARKEILAACDEGVWGAVYGAFDWGGGLEEQWAYHQCTLNHDSVSFDLKTLDRAVARERRFAEMNEKFRDASRGSGSPPVHAEAPGLGYPRPFRYVPHPFETIRVMREIRRMGATKLALCGVANDPGVVPFDVNRESLGRWLKDPDQEVEAIVKEIARDWVGEEDAGALVSAWRLTDEGWSFRPLWNHMGWVKQLLPGPLVPDPSAVERSELRYFDSAALKKYDEIIGHGALIPHERDESLRFYVLESIYPKSMDSLRKAAEELEILAGRCDAAAQQAVVAQRDAVQLALLVLRHQKNWYEAGCYLDPGDAPHPSRSLEDIIDDEMGMTRELIALLKGRAEKFLALFPYDFMVYEYGPGIVDQLRERIVVMERHRRDPIRPVSKETARTRAHDASYAPVKK